MPRPKPLDLPNMTGPGVAQEKYKDLDRLGDEFIELRDKKAETATKMRTVEKKLAEKMSEKGITRYRFGDQEMLIKIGPTHIKIKTVKVEDIDNGEPETSGDE